MRFLLVTAAAFLLLPASAFACACCAERGSWSSVTSRVGAYEFGELERVRFGPSATTYVGAAGLEGITGIAPPSARYRIALRRTGRRWTLLLSAPGGRRGSLLFLVPHAAQLLAVDLRDGRSSGGGGPLLYKEWRLEGAVAGTGVFLAGMSNARFRLILHGRGNSCLTADDFTHWTLQVLGGGARFALFGSLRR